MSFPLFLVLIPFALFFIIYFLFIIMDLFHLVHFAEVHFAAFFTTFLFFASITYILFWSWTLLLPIDWQQTVSLLQNTNFTSPNSF